jgi:hypothetical protein
MSKFDTSDKKIIETIFFKFFNIKRGWQENRLERPMRIGVRKVPLLKFTFTLIMY